MGECFRDDDRRSPMVVSGAICEALVRRVLHPGCRTCECFELTWMLGAWVTDQYWIDRGGSVSRVRGVGVGTDDDGIVTHGQFAHNLRPWTWTRVSIPEELLRPRLRGLARSPS